GFFFISMSARKPFYRPRLKAPSLRSRIYSCLKMKQLPVSPSMTLKRSRTTSLQCNMVSVASREVFPFHCASFERFTQSYCVADAARTKHRANFAAHRIGLEAADREMPHSYRLHQNE